MARWSVNPAKVLKWTVIVGVFVAAMAFALGIVLSGGCELAGVSNKPRTTDERKAETDSTVKTGDGSTVDSKTETTVGDAPKAGSDIRTGDGSRVTSVTFSLAEYGGYGATGIVALGLGTLWARRHRQVTDNALERVMAFIEAARPAKIVDEDSDPGERVEDERRREQSEAVERIVEALRAFDDAVQRRIHKTAKRVGR